MERRELEYFLAIAESGSFTGAAQTLRIAQPSLSHAIGSLEQRLGGKVFHRLPHGVALTPAGEARSTRPPGWKSHVETASSRSPATPHRDSTLVLQPRSAAGGQKPLLYAPTVVGQSPTVKALHAA
ncbi:LysR family transcriptional regulator [Saccharopolyspora sp. NPDC002376]